MYALSVHNNFVVINCDVFLRVLQNLESQEKKHIMHKDTLSREHRYLRRRLDQLTTTLNVNKRRSVSESSSYTTASAASTSSSACSTSSSPSISESGTSPYILILYEK